MLPKSLTLAAVLLTACQQATGASVPVAVNVQEFDRMTCEQIARDINTSAAMIQDATSASMIQGALAAFMVANNYAFNIQQADTSYYEARAKAASIAYNQKGCK